MTSAPQEPLLRVENLRMHFPIRGRGLFARTRGHVHAVNDVNFTIRPGEVLGLVGESGCGKTTLGRCIVRSVQPTAGQLHYRTEGGGTVDLAALGNRELRPYQQRIRVVFQDPFSSLNPRMTILQIVGDPLVANGLARGSEVEDRVAEILAKVGLSPGHMRRYPHAFSGGERQRVNIARALILQPELVIADEAVSALDVSVQAQILNLLRDLQDDLNLTYLFISHDMSVVESICNRVAVMYLGRIVELADTDQLYRRPEHPYTEALLSAVPRPDPRLRGTGRRVRLADNFPDSANPPDGCYFHTRCRYADQERCVAEAPALRTVAGDHLAACHHSEALRLAGVASEHAGESR
ncbi:peptide/nickel transport system ATP-binding protein [Actinopolymorpha cephalotaxi]|uniref:Peptide/nickel transport system ATP-binding protein n=1 Tax=Actinopolymorpha cephalotaxi TaxID=504797 RepID=A0A1I3A9L8_9ACTN|nr:oligopeptide/dipeptide ABC transporter ATP-binding protein [Actinopolymorpha cephalotaxi]NYH85279.1 peptide/nickel transport system ATP-binding protein [Actinopolymorpha cephalotaxi]SFH46419.1 peptide/nickel transport system ATP-binding protein [Actinopolymorpha cephalotaxi]